VAEAAPVNPANAPAAEDAPGAPQAADGVPSAEVAAEDAPGAVPAAADAPIPPQTDETAAADDDAAPPAAAEPATAPAAETPVPASEGTALAANPAALPANEDVGGQAPLDRPAEPAIDVEREAGPLATVTIERHPVLPDGTVGTDSVPPTATGAVPAREPAATASSAPGTAPRVLSPIFSRADSAPATARPPAETRTAALEPAATPPAAAEPPAASASGAVWRVQLAALGSRPAAESAWRALRGRHPEILGSLPVNYQEYDSGQATLVRVQAGSFADRAAAGRACAALRSAGTDCFVVGGGR
jgi:hypothetical protein